MWDEPTNISSLPDWVSSLGSRDAFGSSIIIIFFLLVNIILIYPTKKEKSIVLEKWIGLTSRKYKNLEAH